MIRQAASVIRSWYAECSAEVEMVTAERAAAMSGVSKRAIYRRVENTQIHFIETSETSETGEGGLWICSNSL